MKKTLICLLAGLATPALGQGTAPRKMERAQLAR